MPVNTAKALLDTFADLYPGAREAIMQARQTKKQKTFDVSEYIRRAKQILQPYAPNFDAETSAKSLRDLINSAKANPEPQSQIMRKTRYVVCEPARKGCWPILRLRAKGVDRPQVSGMWQKRGKCCSALSMT